MTAMSKNSNEQEQQKTELTKKSANEALADFALEIFERARQLQRERTGLLSNQDGMKMAVMQCFEKAVADINLSIAHIRLFAGEGKEETLKEMLERLEAVSSFAAVTAAATAAAVAEEKEKEEPQQEQTSLPKPEQLLNNKERTWEECLAP